MSELLEGAKLKRPIRVFLAAFALLALLLAVAVPFVRFSAVKFLGWGIPCSGFLSWLSMGFLLSSSPAQKWFLGCCFGVPLILSLTAVLIIRFKPQAEMSLLDPLCDLFLWILSLMGLWFFVLAFGGWREWLRNRE